MHVNTILVPIDFSEYSKLALNYAAGLARTLGAKLKILHVAEVHRRSFYSSYSEMEPMAEFRARRVQKEHQGLEALTHCLPNSNNLQVETIVRQGHPVAEVVDTATRAEADVIVISAPRKKFRPRFFFGGIADQIVRSAKVPVLTVLRPRDTELGSGMTTLQPEVKRILVASDLSGSSFRAVESALCFARRKHAKLELLHVKRGLSSPPPRTVRRDDVASMQMGIKHYLNDGVEVKYVVEHGRPSKTILAESEESDLIVMYTHGRHGLEHALHHNVCEKVLSQANCPVLTVAE